MIKKLIKLSLLLTTIIMMTSCLDGLHHITKKKNGDVVVTFKMIASKALFDMANNMGGGDGSSLEEEFGSEIIEEDDIHDMVPGLKSVRVEMINDEIDFGFVVTMTIDDLSKVPADTPFIPHIYNDRLEIFPYMSESGSTSEDESGMAMAFMASAKYKVIVSKTIYPAASKAYLASLDQELEFTLVDLGDSYLIDVPFAVMMLDEIEDLRVVLR